MRIHRLELRSSSLRIVFLVILKKWMCSAAPAFRARCSRVCGRLQIRQPNRQDCSHWVKLRPHPLRLPWRRHRGRECEGERHEAERNRNDSQPAQSTRFQSAAALAGPQAPTKRFVSALFQSSTSTRWDVFSFGTDSSLATDAGWDNVTGLGTPNGLKFIRRS